MTPEQWRYITGRLEALEATVLALAASMPNRAAALAAIADQKEGMTTAFLNSQKLDEDIEEARKHIERIQAALGA